MKNLSWMFACGIAAFGGAPLLAQDPSLREIQEIAKRVDEQLREIDRLLLESSKARGGEGGSRPQQLLQQSRQQSEVVEQGIDELITKLTEMKNQSQSSQQSQDQQQQDQQQQQQQGQPQQQGQNRQRRENEMPDFVQQGEQQQQPQGQPQPGEQQQQQQQQQRGQRPEGGEQDPVGGENRPANAMPDQETAPGQPGTGEDEWGKLPPYMNFLKNRGSSPKVPDKFRKYWEAYLKSTGDGR